MAEISLREQLQPGLLDRLSDDERFVSLIHIQTSGQDLERLGIRSREIGEILSARALRPCPPPADGEPAAPGEVDLWFTAIGRSFGIQSLRELVLKPPGAPTGVALQSFCRISARASLNLQTETMDRRLFTMRRLREAVLRDLAWLLNSASYDTSEELARYPQVRKSVLNFGMPSLAGKHLSSVDAVDVARRIEQAIACFEPRLSRVHVQPAAHTDDARGFALAFTIEAELWGQPLPQSIAVRTSFDVETGHAVLTDVGSR
jgi:type VI secretion system protein ImpF